MTPATTFRSGVGGVRFESAYWKPAASRGPQGKQRPAPPTQKEMTMGTIDMKALGVDIEAVMKTAMENPPFPLDGTAALEALKELIQAKPFMAPIVVPLITSAMAEWASGVSKMVLATNMLGIKMDLTPVSKTPFMKNLLKEEPSDA